MVDKTQDFKRPRIISFFLILGLAFQALAEAALLSCLVFGDIDMSRFTDRDWVPEDAASILFALGSLLVLVMMVVNIILLGFWVYRTNKNTHNLPIPDLNYEPGWAVGWWFIPFANLWKPFDVMCELYNANRDPQGWHELPRPRLLWIWWVINWLQIIPSIIIKFAEADKTSTAAAEIYALLFGLGFIRISLLLTIVMRINAFQKTAQAKLNTASVF